MLKIIQTFVFKKIILSMVIALFKWMFFSAVLCAHPVYVCVTEVNYNNSEKMIEITSRIFTDDFEKTLSQNSKSLVNVSQPKNKVELEKQISSYFSQHLSFKVNDSTTPFSFIGYEIEDDAILCFLQVEKVQGVKKIEISNTLLHDFNKDQANIIHVVVGGERKSVKLDSPKNKASFNF